MSFDINPPSKNLSNIQASAKSQDGGAGNTGYFMRGESDEDLGLRFKESKGDLFEKNEKSVEEDDESFLDLFFKFIENLIEKIKAFFIKK